MKAPRIFVSYSRDDRPFVDQLIPILEKKYGYTNVWYDKDLLGAIGDVVVAPIVGIELGLRDLNWLRCR